MAKVQEVTIKTSPANGYATVVRSMITAANACKKLGDEQMLGHVMTIHEWATRKFTEEML